MRDIDKEFLSDLRDVLWRFSLDDSAEEDSAKPKKRGKPLAFCDCVWAIKAHKRNKGKLSYNGKAPTEVSETDKSICAHCGFTVYFGEGEIDEKKQ